MRFSLERRQSDNFVISQNNIAATVFKNRICSIDTILLKNVMLHNLSMRFDFGISQNCPSHDITKTIMPSMPRRIYKFIPWGWGHSDISWVN